MLASWKMTAPENSSLQIPSKVVHSSVAALASGWNVQGGRKTGWFRMLVVGPAMGSNTKNRLWDVKSLNPPLSILCLPQGLCICSSFCLECFYLQLPLSVIQFDPKLTSPETTFSLTSTIHHPLSHYPLLLLQHLLVLGIIILDYVFLICIHQIELSSLQREALFLSPLYPECLEQQTLASRYSKNHC